MTSVTYYPGYSQVQVTENLIVRTILSITQSQKMVVTTSEDAKYRVGMKVRFLIPIQFGMQELNIIDAQVVDANGAVITLSVDSSRFSPFSYPSSLPNAYTPPSIIPNSSGPYVGIPPLPYGNQDSFEGTIYNAGQPL